MKLLSLAALPLVVAGCAPVATLPDPAPLAEAAQPVQLAPSHAPALLTGYTPRRAGAPDPWRDLNDRQSPAGGQP
ncbi:hypothetical protein [Roseivivax sp. CAU 1761]